MSSMYDALPVALPPTTSGYASPLVGSSNGHHHHHRLSNGGRSSVSPTGSLAAAVSRRSPSITNGGSPSSPGQSASSPSHHANSCMLVNGSQRKLSNSYLRYQRRYSKHG